MKWKQEFLCFWFNHEKFKSRFSAFRTFNFYVGRINIRTRLYIERWQFWNLNRVGIETNREAYTNIITPLWCTNIAHFNYLKGLQPDWILWNILNKNRICGNIYILLALLYKCRFWILGNKCLFWFKNELNRILWTCTHLFINSF